jgi:four helix bundle protein
MSFLFENMRVYQKSMAFVEGLLPLLDQAPKGHSIILDQLRRASMSIPSNLAEGLGRWHKGDRKQFFWIARGSANECVVYLRIAVGRRILKLGDYPRLKQELDVIAKMITSLIASQ